MKKVSEMSFKEKKRIQIITVVILGSIIVGLGFLRIQKKVISIMETSDLQELKIDVDIPELKIPEHNQEELEQEIQDEK